eukprot:g57744.t1
MVCGPKWTLALSHILDLLVEQASAHLAHNIPRAREAMECIVDIINILAIALDFDCGADELTLPSYAAFDKPLVRAVHESRAPKLLHSLLLGKGSAKLLIISQVVPVRLLLRHFNVAKYLDIILIYPDIYPYVSSGEENRKTMRKITSVLYWVYFMTGCQRSDTLNGDHILRIRTW